MATNVREAIAIIARDGWFHIRTDGSHRHFKHATKAGTVTIAGELSDTLPVGTWLNVQRQAGLR